MYSCLLLLAGVLFAPGNAVARQQGPVLQLRETFDDDRNLDRRASSGAWGNFRAVPGLLGGDGRHGAFDPRLGLVADPGSSPGVYIWNTDHMVIPGSQTLSGEDETVTDGRFYFTDFFVGTGETVVFTGLRPVQIFVRGQVLIDGAVLANAPDVPAFGGRPVATPGIIEGQPGGTGGPGGGSGGDGADSGNNAPNPLFHGKDGEDVQLVAGHAYASRALGTGGKGSVQFPASGLRRDITFNIFGSISAMVGAGGGGGGFVGQGSRGIAKQSETNELGPPSDFGLAMGSLFPIPAGTSSLDNFQIGGSGGGGGGSHAFLASIAVPLESWKAGAAGAGGGGALAIRAGHDVRILTSGSVQARGGNGVTYRETFEGLPAPGGGGSGGSILVQSGIDNGIVQRGILDASGGDGGRLRAGGFILGVSDGGAGAPGFIRLETPNGNPNPGATIPPSVAQNSGVLTDRDLVVGSQSLWYSIGRAVFQRYEIDATIDGVAVTFSDNSSFGTLADDPNGPLYVRFQAARVDPATRRATPGTLGPWRRFLNAPRPSPLITDTINHDGGDGFRFALFFNKAVAQDIRVTGVSVFYEAVGPPYGTGSGAGLVTYGASTLGCEGSMVIGGSSNPTLGNSAFAITCDHTPRSALGGLLLSGASLTTPINLSGVDVWIDLTSPLLSVFTVLSDQQGTVRFGLPIPATPSLMGLKLYSQLAWPDICAPGGISASNALEITVH